ncbi:MAG: tripartite tricarboxylate transporter TctB family protein [Bacillota bacterium]
MAFADRFLSVLVLIFGTFVLVQSFELQYFLDDLPGPGFAPFWIGVTLIVLAVLIFISSLFGQAKTEKSPFTKEDMLKMFGAIGGSLLAAVTSAYIGLLLSLGLLAGFFTWFYGLRKWQTVILTSVLTPVILFLIFSLGLGVIFPTGMLGF